MYWTCIILFCLVYFTIIHLLSKGFRGACRCSFWGFSGRLPFVQLLNLPFYFYFDRTCCVTFERDDFIEEACVFRCHPDFYTKSLSRLRWAFVIICGRTTASGTDIQYDKGIISRIFYFKNSCFLFGFRKYAEVYFAVYGFCRCFDPIVILRSFPGNLFQIQIPNRQVMHRIADYFHFVVPVKQECLESDILWKLVQLVQPAVPINADRSVEVVTF